MQMGNILKIVYKKNSGISMKIKQITQKSDLSA